MAKNLSIDREIETNKDGIVVIKTTTRSEYSNEELLGLVPENQKKIYELEQMEKQTKKFIEDKMAEKELEELPKRMEAPKSFIKVANEALKPYLDELYEKGLKRVDFLKKKEGFDRLPQDAEGKRSVVKNRILADVSKEFKLNDVSHPVMIKLRENCFKENKEGKK